MKCVDEADFHIKKFLAYVVRMHLCEVYFLLEPNHISSDPLAFNIQLIYDGHISCWTCYDDTTAHPEEGLC